ncbi:MAG: chromosomal replication initiator protein DnaA [Phycisphaerales bacterium]|nr:chromosomal replication initiator protein DnaA [Phycisphaerales bacterium]
MNTSPDPMIRDEILAHLKRHHPDRCRQWFEEIEIVDLAAGVLTLSAVQPVQLRYLQRECVEIFREAAQSVTGRLLSVVFISSDEADQMTPASAGGVATLSVRAPVVVASASAPAARTAITAVNGRGNGHSRHPVAAAAAFEDEPARTPGATVWGTLYDEMVINPDYSFETYIVGPNNRLAHAAAVAVSQQPGVAYNPFFIHSGVGLGKTHLLQAICQAILSNKPDCRIYYVSCEGFVSQFMEAVQAGEMLQFRHKFRDIDVLVVDDIHFLAAHERTQEEFFHTFNSLWQSRKQIVLSSDAAPNEIPKLEDRLLSRFKSGLVARMDKPCYETRLAILRIKSRLRGLVLPDDVLCFVAHHTDSNIRVLEGALTQLQATAMAMNREIDLELAREALGDAPSPLTPIVSIQAIIAAIARHFEVKQTDLFSKRRHKSIALPRQVGMYLARCHTSHSLQEIGGFFGGRDHTTVMHAVEKISRMRSTDPAMDRRLDMIERDLAIRLS